MSLWLDASKGITIGTGVSQWSDQSGVGNNVTQGTGANQPAFVSSWRNGKPAILFASTKYLQRASLISSIPQPMTIIMCGSWTSTPLVFAVDGSTAGNRVCVGSTAGNTWSLSHGSLTSGVGTAKTATTPFFSVSRFTSSPESTSSSSIYASGVTESGTIDPDGAETFLTGISVGSSYVPSNYWDGHIAELMIYSRILTPAEETIVSSYLKAKYAL